MYMNPILITILTIITIILSIAFFIDSDKFVLYSNTGLGKLIAILLIVFYAIIHIGAGIAAMIFILSYYKFYGYDSWNIFHTIDFLDGIDAVYYINLDRSKERRDKMEEMFKDTAFLGKPIIRIKAVDGKDASEPVFDKYNITNRRNTKLLRPYGAK